MPQKELLDVLELFDRNVRGQGGLQPLFSFDPDSDARFLYHPDVVASVADATDHFAVLFLQNLGNLRLLLGSASANNNRVGRFAPGQEQVQEELVSQDNLQTGPRDDQTVDVGAELVENFADFPVVHRADLEVLLLLGLEPCAHSDALRSFQLVPREHPHFLLKRYTKGVLG